MRPENQWFTPEELAAVRNRFVAVLFVLVAVPLVAGAVVADLVVGGVVAAAVLALTAFLVWYNRAFERSAALRFTADAIEYRRGVWYKQHSEVPYSRITNVTTSQGPIQRMLDAGSLEVQTAGQSGQAGAELAVSGLPDYEALKEQLMENARAVHGDATAGRSTQTATRSDEYELLSEVRRIRELLE
ncbi:PH domain-containing protein [Halobacterium bonnevillei]|uniref:PH domain-containing protein n=1 Tax=Halobacterium bonnevillei TaxID=2692200 RepID=A0A6B0SEJ6_9EURY|nr:PH domain-containing protein [Halobacterium bonnevillei]MXR19407.1 PH domain-containing protein [Halobacterium bonnevillei]